jgi:cysteine desulfurase
MQLPIYLDNQATTPLDPRVMDAMAPFFAERFGNPHSTSHEFGWIAESAVAEAREQIAHLIGAKAREIIFTSGATESNNLAIKGVARARRQERDHLVTLRTEHKCVLQSMLDLEAEGFHVDLVDVDPSGLVDLDRLAQSITERTALVSVMAANNEIGVFQPIENIAAICRRKGAIFHSDAAQAVGKIPLDVGKIGVDLLSATAHKYYGPKGIGVLYVRAEPRPPLQPLFSGGGQEQGIRPGTLPAPLCVGMGAASDAARQDLASEAVRLTGYRDRLWQKLSGGLSDVWLNGDRDRRLPGNLNVGFGGVDGEELVLQAKELALSSGSACTSTAIEPSHVLTALGLAPEQVASSIRIGLGRFTTDEELDFAGDLLVDAVSTLRRKI